MNNTMIARNNWSALIPGSRYGENNLVEIKVEAKLYRLGSNEYPYFSITGEIVKRGKRYRDPVITSGAIHEEILRAFPSLAPLVLVHLSGPDGQPMHAEANARYWAGLCTYPDGSPMGELNLTMLAKHLQTDKDTARELHKGLSMGLPWDTVTRELKLIELWSEQAGEARALLVDVKEPANA